VPATGSNSAEPDYGLVGSILWPDATSNQCRGASLDGSSPTISPTAKLQSGGSNAVASTGPTSARNRLREPKNSTVRTMPRSIADCALPATISSGRTPTATRMALSASHGGAAKVTPAAVKQTKPPPLYNEGTLIDAMANA